MILGSLLFLWAIPRGRWILRYPIAGILAGIFLAFHFATWIASLFYTTVASSVVLVTTTPIFTSIWEGMRGNLVHPRRTIAVIGLVMVGMVLLAGGDWAWSPRSLIGDALALIGALCATGYLLSGRRVRQDVDSIAYVSPVYTIAAMVLLVLSGGMRVSIEIPSLRAWMWLIFLAVIPQGVGHTLINWGLGKQTATSVSLVILGEPVLSGLWAWILFHEVPSPLALVGMGLIGVGVGFHIIMGSSSSR